MPSRYANVDEYYATLEPVKSKLIADICEVAQQAHPELKLKIAWNQPVLCLDGTWVAERYGLKKAPADQYVAGMSSATNWLLYNPFSKHVMQAFAPRFSKLHAGLHTFRVPLDWQIDEQLIVDLIDARLAEIDAELRAKA